MPLERRPRRAGAHWHPYMVAGLIIVAITVGTARVAGVGVGTLLLAIFGPFAQFFGLA